MHKAQDYLPALRFKQLTPFYDPVMRWVFREDAFRGRLIAQAGLRPGMRVLDLGCGTGTLDLQILQAQPEVDLVGLDGDQRVLDIARAKADRSGLRLVLDLGDVSRLPYSTGSFDRVLSSLVFHHLKDAAKRQALAEAFRVLRAGGELHLVDFGPPHSIWSRIVAPVMARLEQTTANFQGLLPTMMEAAGFTNVVETARQATVFGSLSFYRAAIS